MTARDEHPKEVPLEYARITEHVYLGTNMCCQTHFDEQLLAEGLEADISLEEERLDAPQGVKFFFWFPTKDKTAPSHRTLLLGAELIQHLADLGIKTYVHCKWGHGRSPTLIAAYLVLTGISTEEAFTLIKRKRPSIHPMPEQVAAVRDFERHLWDRQ